MAPCIRSRSVWRLAICSLVLPGAVGTPFAGWSKAKRALDKAILDARANAAAKTGTPAAPLVPWSIHDLRRTVATGLQRLGVRLEVTEAVLTISVAAAAVLPACINATIGRPRSAPRSKHGPPTCML